MRFRYIIVIEREISIFKIVGFSNGDEDEDGKMRKQRRIK